MLSFHYRLGIGGMIFAEAPLCVTTVLGSCVAITLYCQKEQCGAICHAVMPNCREKGGCRQCRRSGRHVACAVKRMLWQFHKRNIECNDIEMKIFGGANILTESNSGRPKFTVGPLNIAAARESARRLGLVVKAEESGGTHSRKLVFDLSTGTVSVTWGKRDKMSFTM